MFCGNFQWLPIGEHKKHKFRLHLKRYRQKNKLLKPENMIQCPAVILYCRQKPLNTFPRLEFLCLASAIKICDKLIERKSQGNKIIQSQKQCFR